MFAPKVDQKLKKLCFHGLVISLGKTCTNLLAWSLDPPRPYFLHLIKTLSVRIALSPNLPLKTYFSEKLYFFSSWWEFCWAQTSKPYNFRLKKFKVLLLTIIWIMHIRMSKIWVGHFLALPGIAWFSQKMSHVDLLKLDMLYSKVTITQECFFFFEGSFQCAIHNFLFEQKMMLRSCNTVIFLFLLSPSALKFKTPLNKIYDMCYINDRICFW